MPALVSSSTSLPLPRLQGVIPHLMENEISREAQK
jgi:hypothetical protein